MNLRLFTKRTVWLPTRRGWLCLLALATLLLFTGVRTAHPFLAITRPVPANVLVVEGWLSDYAVEAAAVEFKKGTYDCVVTVGGPIPKGDILAGHRSYSTIAARTLLKLGIPQVKLIDAPAAPTFRQRTFEAAKGAKLKLAETGLQIHGINVVSGGPHARRTRTVYRRVFGDQGPIGVISIASQEYDARHWWRSSEGIKETFSEGLGWAYEWVFASGR